ncbi:MAG: phage holin family protein [Gaiella sp.]
MRAHASGSHRRRPFGHFNPRAMLVRFVANALLIGILILVLPGFELNAERPVLAVLWLAIVFGVVTAVVGPVLEFLALPYLLQTFGLVVILIDVVLLALLDLSRVFEITSLWSLLVGAVLAAVIGFCLENVLGLSPPVLDDTVPEDVP